MDRPSENSHWADVGGDVTEPSEGQKNTGWATSTVVRQFLNWILNVLFRWVIWFDQTNHRTTDMHPNFALPQGTPPTIAAGLVAAAADFSGRVYAVGWEVPLTTSPARTYAINTDTYWDLRRDTTWVATEVASGAGAPAVAANSTRVYMVRTNAVDRILLTDFRGVRQRFNAPVGFEGAVQVGPDLSTGYPVAADQLSRGVTYHLVPSSGIAYQLLKYFFPDAGGYVGARLYVQNLGAPNNFVKLSLVWGADYAPSIWTARATSAYRLDFVPNGNAAGMRYSRISGLTPNVSTMTDTDWNIELLANNTRRQMPVDVGLRLGGDLNLAGSPNVNITPMIEWVRGNGLERYTLKTYNRLGAEASIAEYLSTTGPVNGAGTLGTCDVVAHNCTWDEGNALWRRTTAAGLAWLEVVSSTGHWVLAHLAAGPATWADTIDNTVNTVWQQISSIASDSLFARHVFTDQAPATPAANGIYSGLVPKNTGWLHTNGAGGLTWSGGVNIAAITVVDATTITVDLVTPMNGVQYGVHLSRSTGTAPLIPIVYTIASASRFSISSLNAFGGPSWLNDQISVTFSVLGFQ